MDTGNYRPISILPVISKLIEKIAHQQLYDYLSTNNLLSHAQSGFRKRFSIQWSLRRKTAPSAVTKWSLVRVRSHIGVRNVQEILFGVDKGLSHKTSRSHNRGSCVAGTTVLYLIPQTQ